MENPFDGNMESGTNDTHAFVIQTLLRKYGVEDMASGGTIVDIGTGDGKLLAALSERYPDAQFFGVSTEPAKAKRNAPHAEIVNEDLKSLHFPDDFFTMALTCNIFDYASDHVRYGGGRIKPGTYSFPELFSEVGRILVPRGLYVPVEEGRDAYFSPETKELFGSHFDPVGKPLEDIGLFRKAYKK